NTVTFN
nr:Chain A, Agglutinin-like protein 5 [Candida albicans]6RHA_B Chain B, Agglutinin-like protein 5 [Candida albicans]